VCQKHGLTGELLYDFSEYIHDLKDSGFKGSGKRGDFTFKELDELARKFKADLMGSNGNQGDEDDQDGNH